MRKALPVGISDFKKLRDRDLYYIDKSLFIKEVIESGPEVILLPRPRRFGKTLNLSMLRYFFEKHKEDRSYLFDGLKIISEKDICQNYQGKYPVIYLTFKDVKNKDWATGYQMIKKIIGQEYKRHDYLLRSDKLDDHEKDIYKQILTMRADKIFYQEALKDLSGYLERYHDQKVQILIDEYDAPIQSGYLNNYYDQVVHFMRSFLGGGLKDNISLEKGILTGILRVAKESIFSGLNNLSVYSLINKQFNTAFGLLKDEVSQLLRDYQLMDKLEQVKDWYNGYQFGQETIYNPWSIVKYVENNGIAEPYWINTSSNDLIHKIITEGIEVKED